MSLILVPDSPIAIGAAVGCVCGLAHALNRPASRFREPRVSKWAWVSAFGMIVVLLVASDIAIRLTHAWYDFRAFESLALGVTTASAFVCVSLYIIMLAFRHPISPDS